MCLLSQLTFLFIITLLAFFIVVFLIYQLNLFIIIFSETVKNLNLPYVPMFTGGTYSRSLKTRPPPLVSSHFQKRKKEFSKTAVGISPQGMSRPQISPKQRANAGLTRDARKPFESQNTDYTDIGFLPKENNIENIHTRQIRSPQI